MALAGLKVIEFAGLAPGPFAGLVLADNGASVTRIDRPSTASNDILCRGKRSIVVDSKTASGGKLLEKLISSADVLIDPFRPGVMERLGLSPELFLGDGKRKGLNEKLIYARVVGFPRTGPQRNMAGHDINYLALSGVLAMLPGTQDKPTFPLNLVADFAGGGLLCAMGILLALIERVRTGQGQVVDTDMASILCRFLGSFLSLSSTGLRGSLCIFISSHLLDGGAPFYNIYTCQDGGWMSVGCLEPQFFKTFIETFTKALSQEFDPLNGWKPDASMQFSRGEWPSLKEYLTKGFLTKPRDAWAAVYQGTDACALPVLSPEEAGKLSTNIPPFHPSHRPPRSLASKEVTIKPGQHTERVLRDFGFSDIQIQQLRAQGALGPTVSKL